MDENVKEQLHVELVYVRNELEAERQQGQYGSVEKIAQLEQREVSIIAKLDGISKVEKEQAIEDKVHSEITFAIPGVDFTQLPVDLINVIHAVVKADRRRIYAEHASELDQVEKERDEWSSSYQTSINDYELLKIDYNSTVHDLKEKTEETYRLIAERDDARKNRDNAAKQLEESKAEIERLKSEIDDYQKAKVLGERQAQSVIDVTPNEAEEINAAIQRFVSSENWGSVEKLYLPDGTYKVVKRDELQNWAPITIPETVGGGETAPETFQGETAEADAANGGVSVTEEGTGNVILKVPTLAKTPSEEGHQLDQEDTGLGMAGEAVTREEFQELTRKVYENAEKIARIEQSQRSVA